MPVSKIPSEELFQRHLAGDQTAIDILRGDMEELVRAVARRFAADATEEELVPVGMTYFDLALEKYAERRRGAEAAGQKLYKFSTYFTWWIRESLKTYLGTSNTPLRRIIPRSNLRHN